VLLLKADGALKKIGVLFLGDSFEWRLNIDATIVGSRCCVAVPNRI
jgi:hypothetical protein